MPQFKTKRLSHASKKPNTPTISDEKKEVSEKKKMRFWGFSYKTFLLSIGLILLGAFVYQVTSTAFQGNEKNGSENFQPTLIQNIVKKKVVGTTNILLAGIGGKGHEGSDLTDSIMLASLDGEKNRVTLISIPRDLYVSYGKNAGAGRINTLYDLGKRDKVGIRYLAEKVQDITGQPIDHYAVIDFSGFKQIVDILGGITVDVPEDLTDREYPDNNWGYMTFSVKKGVQNFNGDTALKYARSRHSTSDFDRSVRQQLILKGIKQKAGDLGYITSPEKISELYNALISHLDTDMSIASMIDFALTFRDIESKDISVTSVSNECLSLIICPAGSYLYAPDRGLFGGQAVIIPENASISKLSYYDEIRRFVDVTFRFPSLRTAERNIVIVSDKTMRKRAEEIGFGLAKMGFPLSLEKTLTTSGSIEKSHINIYWYPEMSVGISPESETPLALKYLEESIPYNIVERNEYINTSGPKIEIVIGKDGEDYFSFFKNPYYIPAPPKETLSGEETLSGNILSLSGTKKPSSPLPEKTQVIKTPQTKTGGVIQTSTPLASSGSKKDPPPSPEGTPPLSSGSSSSIRPGEWENF